MPEPGKSENPSFEGRAEAIRRIQEFKKKLSSRLKGNTLQFIGRLCTQTDLSSLLDPNSFRVPLTDTISVGIQRVTVKESLASKGNPNPKSREVTIPVFHFEDKQMGVSVDGSNVDPADSIQNQKHGKPFMDLYYGEDNIDYDRVVDGLSYAATKHKSYVESRRPLTLREAWRVTGVGKESWKVNSLISRKDVVERFIQAIDPKATGGIS